MKEIAALITLTGFLFFEEPLSSIHVKASKSPEDLKTKAFKILENKCNVCHRKQNPFMVFSWKNMAKRAEKIHKQVFVKKRMPKGDDIKLTTEEYSLLNNWLQTQITE